MIKNKSELSDHIYTLIKSGELSFQTYSDWLYWGDNADIFEKLDIEHYEECLRKAVDKDYYLRYLQEKLVDLTRQLYNTSLHSANEVNLIAIKALSNFLKQNVNYND